MASISQVLIHFANRLSLFLERKAYFIFVSIICYLFGFRGHWTAAEPIYISWEARALIDSPAKRLGTLDSWTPASRILGAAWLLNYYLSMLDSIRFSCQCLFTRCFELLNESRNPQQPGETYPLIGWCAVFTPFPNVLFPLFAAGICIGISGSCTPHPSTGLWVSYFVGFIFRFNRRETQLINWLSEWFFLGRIADCRSLCFPGKAPLDLCI